MQTNRVKRIVREGGLAPRTYAGGIADPQIVEIIGHAGFDAAFIDLVVVGPADMLPAPEQRLLQSLKAQAVEARKTLGG